jgi:hypothetical protein
MIIAAREVREKARLFVICAGLSLVPFAATLLPGARGQSADVIAIVGGFLSAILGLGIAVTFGASTIVRDLAERRMSFYFTRPVSAPAIWIGKAAAGLFISLACFAIIATPSALAARKAWATQWLGDIEPLSVAALAIVVLFFLSHTMSTIIRSRSPLLALDFLFAIAAVAALYLIARPMLIGAATDLARIVLTAIGIAVVLVLAIAPVWQLANGRSDIRRSHAALMRFLWPSIAIVLLIAGGIVAWVIQVSPADIVVRYVGQPPRGTAAIVTGRAPRAVDYHATFVIDRASGASKRMGTPPWWGAHFSDDGRVLVWLQPVGTFSLQGVELHTLNGATGIVIPLSSSIVLSGDGARVAITNGKLLAVHELATGKLLASAAGLDSRARHQVFFLTPDVVRVFEYQQQLRTPTPLRIFELDIRARSIRKTGERMLVTTRQAVSVSGDGARMFVRGANVIADGRTGQTIAEIAASDVSSSAMLFDGSVALVSYGRGVPHLRTYDRDGAPRHDVAFPNVRSVWIAGEIENGKLILTVHGRTMCVVDLASGSIEQRLENVRGPMPHWSTDPRLIRYAADQEFVAVDKNGKLIVWKNEGRASARPLLSSR